MIRTFKPREAKRINIDRGRYSSHFARGASLVLISIEGIDGSGKGTQAQRLVDFLSAAGWRAALLGFPRYSETFFGARIGEFLNGHFGGLDQVSPLLAALLFAGDRFESRSRLQQLLETHDVVVLDRYVASNVAHQAAKLDGPDRQQLIAQIEQLEFSIYGLPRPDRVLLLDIPAAVSRKLVARKARRDYTAAEADLQEADTDYQERVRQLYRDLATGDDSWRTVSVVNEQGELRGIDDIAAELSGYVDVR
ncbi:MAG: thymidylate kinase [Planctomycetaceae bacterium]